MSVKNGILVSPDEKGHFRICSFIHFDFECEITKSKGQGVGTVLTHRVQVFVPISKQPNVRFPTLAKYLSTFGLGNPP